jgi:penicillin-binding protein 2
LPRFAIGFWIFQIAQHEKFREMAEENHLRRLPLPAPRGVLLDRDGKVLVDNQSSFNIALVREQTRNLDETLHILAVATNTDEAQLRETVNRRRREPSYRPIVLIENATTEQYIAMMARREELPGIIPQEVPARKYPGSEMAAHLFGYVGEVREDQLQHADYSGIEPGAVVGQAGIELAYNRLLMGTDGNKTVIVNSVGREIGLPLVDEFVAPREGKRLQLTIDADVQKAPRMRSMRPGSMAPRSCSIQQRRRPRVHEPPGVRPELLLRRHQSRDVERSQYGRPQAAAEPRRAGTVLSWIHLQDGGRPCGLEEGVITPSFQVHCGGGATFYGRRFACWKKGGHGTVDLRAPRHRAVRSDGATSTPSATCLGVDRITKWGDAVRARREVPTIDLPNELQGLVPSTGSGKREKDALRSGTLGRDHFRPPSGRARWPSPRCSMAGLTPATLANGGYAHHAAPPC